MEQIRELSNRPSCDSHFTFNNGTAKANKWKTVFFIEENKKAFI